MSIDTTHPLAVPFEIIEAIRALPAKRPVTHCGQLFDVPAFSIYATCPSCGEEIKVRSFGATTEIEDVFDAVFEWMANPATKTIAEDRLRAIEEDQ